MTLLRSANATEYWRNQADTFIVSIQMYNLSISINYGRLAGDWSMAIVQHRALNYEVNAA
jgi:hypothetical protein